jgi:hypothetical protein
MAKGKAASETIVLNNVKTTTATKTVELVVVNDQLVADPKDVNPGVNSATNKN